MGDGRCCSVQIGRDDESETPLGFASQALAWTSVAASASTENAITDSGTGRVRAGLGFSGIVIQERREAVGGRLTRG